MSASFASTLTTARTRAGLPIYLLARKAGLSPSSVSRLESGDRTPELETVNRLARGLGLDPRSPERSELLASAGYRPLHVAPLLSCPALAALDEAHRTGSDERRAWIERWIALALEAA
jgi:transcriptional regulator with XRE-family HTH domain